MSIYKHIVVGLDLSEDSKIVLEKAQALAKTHAATVSVCHVIEPLAYAYGGDIPVNLAEAQVTLEEHAEARLKQILNNNPPDSTKNVIKSAIVIGETSNELHQIAEAEKADLIVVGSHGRHGLALLLGSTASGVLHGAKCDVLAIRV